MITITITITITGYLDSVIHCYVLLMGPIQSDDNKQLIPLSVITLSGFLFIFDSGNHNYYWIVKITTVPTVPYPPPLSFRFFKFDFHYFYSEKLCKDLYFLCLLKQTRNNFMQIFKTISDVTKSFLEVF
jgi:hypothetical protein